MFQVPRKDFFFQEKGTLLSQRSLKQKSSPPMYSINRNVSGAI